MSGQGRRYSRSSWAEVTQAVTRPLQLVRLSVDSDVLDSSQLDDLPVDEAGVVHDPSGRSKRGTCREHCSSPLDRVSVRYVE